MKRAAPVVVEASVVLASTPAELWPMLTNTDRSNRLAIGNAANYEPIDPAKSTAARFLVTTTAGGFPMQYEEAPYEWTLHKSLSVYRKVIKGPIHSMSYSMKLHPEKDGGTRVDFRLELEPRSILLRPFVGISGRRFVGQMTKLARDLDAHVKKHAENPYDKPATPASEQRLESARAAMQKRGLPAKEVDAVVELVRNGPDADLAQIRPFELAQTKGLDQHETLRVLLHGTTLGLVELRWALVCPSCRVANTTVESLDQIGDASHCQMCDITYGVELDRAVEATFRPHPSTREVGDKMFCAAGPWRTPHVLVQQILVPGTTKDVEAVTEPGRYRLFARGGVIASVDVSADAPAKASISLEESAFAPAEIKVAPGGTITVKNESKEPLHLKIERLGYAMLAATAQVVTTMPEFRRFFSKDLLKPSTPLKIANCAILFTDLTGSTALYTHAGDAAAFRFVDDHFDVLRKEIGAAKGTVVKTMGDAVMAAFLDATACVRASIASMRAFEEFRKKNEFGELTGLKLGLYAGPCYVVTANDAIDYFGQTVNCASRVQHLAESGEIILEEDVLAQLPSKERDELVVTEHFETKVKGVAEPLRLVRTKLADPASALSKSA